MNLFQSLWHTVEVNKGQFFVRLIPFLIVLAGIPFLWDFMVFHGLNDAQSMDNAQLARQIVRGKGYTTEFLRPHAVAQLRDHVISQSLQSGQTADLFPADKFPPGVPRIIPDTYNAPGYPLLLAAWFRAFHPEFDEPVEDMASKRIYSPDRWIPPLNQIFVILTAFLVFIMGLRLFDERVAWISSLAFVFTELIWHYSITGLSTSFLMFLITVVLLCVVEIICVGEKCFESEEASFIPAWLWALFAGVVLGVACLTRLHLVILLVPIFIFLMVMPRASVGLLAVFLVVVAGMLAPWFLHMNKISGNPLGSNTPYMLYGEGEYKGNEIFCTTSIPNYERLFKDATRKESVGFRYNFDHAWELLGANLFILFFGVSIIHQFKRRRARLFHWLIFACAIALIAANNLGSAQPDPISQWNVLILLFPCMIIVGTAFFFILLDRLNLQLQLIKNLIVIAAFLFVGTPKQILTFAASSDAYLPFPPYWPPAIKSFAQCANPDEWVTSDMPWATAWYADRPSLWLPDSISDFESMHDNVCPTGLIMLTPVTWAEPISTIQSQGEYKDWYAFVLGQQQQIPPNFPLSVHTTTGAGGPQYSLWSDRPRWNGGE